jgi:hypothetical protein
MMKSGRLRAGHPLRPRCTSCASFCALAGSRTALPVAVGDFVGFARIRCFMSTVIRTFHNANKEEVGRLTFDEKDKRLHIQSSAPPGIDRRFRTEKGAANWWESNVDPETGKIRR